MQALISALSDNDFHPGLIEPDGKIHRFNRNQLDRKRSAWLICWQHYTGNGQPFYVCVYGDWRDSEKFEYCSLANRSQEDNDYYRKQIDAAKKAREAEQVKVWAETAEECQALWDALPTGGESDYLNRKRVGNYGCRIKDGVLWLPLRDEQGKLWSIQYVDDKKRFHPAGKVKGNYHLLPGSGDTIVCEGYATGASIHEATGRPVAVAFSASNLPDVARKFPDCTIAGDDDKAGREWAGKCPASRILFPIFTDTTTKPTDFNDLHILEGLDAITAIFNTETPKIFVKCLGHRDANYYYISSDNRQIVKISRESHNRSNLRDLMPESYWEVHYPREKGGSDFDKAADSLMQRARARGIFSDSCVRGVGVWRDNQRFLINLGDGLYYGGSRHTLDALDTNYIYEIGSRVSEPTQKECETGLLLQATQAVNWATPDAGKLLAGWLTLAPVGGALAWRPHIWLTGSAGTGKSWLMQNLIHPFLEGRGHFFQGQTTEAGIRQSIRCDSKAVIFDEFETEDELSAKRIKGVLELMRQASSETEGQVVKGAPSGSAVYYRPQFSALVSSIRVVLAHESDRTRFTTLELANNKDKDRFDSLKTLVNLFDQEYREAHFRGRLGYCRCCRLT